MHTAFVGLGSNLDRPEQRVRLAVDALADAAGVKLVAESSLYRSAPIGHAAQPDFVNAVIEVRTTLQPGALLATLLAIERTQGRERSFRNAPRTLDLDLLLFDAEQMDTPGLTLPHPRMHERAFVLAPLSEIAPDCVIPGRGRAADCLARCAGQRLERISTP